MCVCWLIDVFFFFQAEDGIRDVAVTGVQTCALPIFGGFVCTSSEIAARGNQRPGKNYWHEYGHKHAGGSVLWRGRHGRRHARAGEKRGGGKNGGGGGRRDRAAGRGRVGGK